MRKFCVLAWTTVLALAAAPSAQAALLAPGTTVSPVPIVAAGAVNGTVVADTGLMPYSYASGVDTGTVRELVIQDAGNPLGAGNLTFAYQFQVATGDIGSISGSSYGSFKTDVAQEVGPEAPFFATGTAAANQSGRSGDGSVVRFDFLPGVLPPGTSYILYVRTDATTYTAGTIGLIDGGGTTLDGFAPVPEPASIVMLGCGAASMAGYGWKRRKAAA